MDFASLNQWFKIHGRDLPWRKNQDPWSVLLSEVMLQQTQVTTVIPYYQRWLKRFPTLKHLAKAPLHEVLKMWEGLGYYQRARALHALSVHLDLHNMNLPDCEEGLLKLPGIGPYTAAAISAFAFHRRSAPVDGNVLRVMARYLGLQEDISKASTRQKVQNFLLQHLPLDKPWISSEALIELGATTCKKQPLCEKCPLQNDCYAFKNHAQDLLPKKNKAPATTHLYHHVAVIQVPSGRVLAMQKQTRGLFQDLWLFPYIERDDDAFIDPLHIQQNFEDLLGLHLHFSKKLTPRTHSFTKYLAHLQVFVFQTPTCLQPSKKPHWYLEWIDFSKLQHLPFCSGYREIREELHGVDFCK